MGGTRGAVDGGCAETGSEGGSRRPADRAADMEAEIAAHPERMTRPELRNSAYVRVVVPDKAGPDVDRAAKQLADRIYAALANETGLMPPHLHEIAHRVAKDSKLELTISPCRLP